MTKNQKIIRYGGIAVAALLVIVVLTAIFIVRTDWFRNYVREKIIAATEDATGGRVTIGAFSFEWSHLRATVTNFVIHGTEPATAAPFLRASRVEVDLALLTSIHHLLDVSYLGVEQPQANIIVFPDGRTNIPNPKEKQPASNKTALETVVDLAIGHFKLTDGALTLDSQTTPINIEGKNLQAQLYYNVATQGYKGQIALSPLYVVSGRNTPVNMNVTLPVTLQRDRVELANAKVATALSDLTINGTIEHLKDPKTTARINGRIALADLQSAGNVPMALHARGVPQVIDTDLNVTIDQNTIQVASARMGLGNSNVEASGTLQDPSGRGALEFKTQLALGELGRLFEVKARPDGMVHLNGSAKLKGTSDYLVTGNIAAHDLSFQQGTERIRNVNLVSSIAADPNRIDLHGLRLSAFGGEFNGDAGLEAMRKFNVAGNLRNLDLQNTLHSLGMKQVPYDGVVSGPVNASGDIKAPGTTGIMANVHLGISPGRRGIPVSGRLNADYNGAADNVQISDSYLALPHSRVNLAGSLGNRLNVQLTSRNLNDFLAAMPAASRPAIALNGGTASFTGTVTGKLSNPRVAGHLAVGRFSVEGRPFDSLAADLNASSRGAGVQNGALARGTMQASFAGTVGMKNWKPESYEPVAVNASIRNGDLADIMALAGQKNAPYSGLLTADARITGTVGNPQGSATLNVVNGSAYDQPIDRLQAQVNLSDQLVTIPAASVTSGPARVDFNATFQHPRDSFSTGSLRAHVASNQVALAQIRKLQEERPGTAGTVQLNGDVAGNLREVKGQSEFLLTSVNGDASARGLVLDGQPYGDFSATARTNGNDVRYQVASDFAGSNIHLNGDTQLVKDYPTNAQASIANLPIERVLAAARRTDIPAKGNFSGTATFSGTIDNPTGSADFTLDKPVLYNEPLDRVRARVTYLGDSVDVPLLEVAEKGSSINLTATYNHPKGNFESGRLRFRINSSEIQLAQIQNVQKLRPGLGGILRIAANGDAAVQPKAPRILFSDLNADVSAKGLEANRKKFGDVTLAAKTSGQTLNFTMDSDLANASIHGKGDAQLRGDYPVNAQLTFSNVTWSGLEPLIGPPSPSSRSFDAVTDGQATISGPSTDLDRLRGTLQLTRVQLTTTPTPGSTQKAIELKNDGPIVLALDKSAVHVQRAHLTGPSTDLQASGTLGLRNAVAMDLNVTGNTNLSLLQSFNRNIYSSGTVAMNATVRGSVGDPLVNGRLELHNASINMIDAPNGLSNANGVIVFNGNSASIQSLTAESGGGKVTATGFVGFAGGNPRAALRLTARDVRVRYSGASVFVNSNVTLTGTTQSSLLSGTVMIERLTFTPQNDFGSMLSRAAPPVQSPSATSGPLTNMRLDVHIRTAPSVAVQASLAQNIEANADVRLRGTFDTPGMLGRVDITSGDLIFFGTKYTVNQGTVAFYNPTKIEPILNVDLETQAKGVDVVLTVTGPIDNMKLTYTSDPPLQFQEIVSLLATGTTPTSDATLLAKQPAPPPQTFQQMGESALLSQAIANPVSSQLQRVFGVNQLKIDPTFTSGSELPQARLTLQQQVTTNLTFTYITDLSNANAQIVRVEWAVNPQWSAVATRDEYGRFGVDFFYKKQFR